MNKAKNRRFQLVIFDMDGLLLDTERVGRSCWQQAAGEHGFVLTDEMYSAVIGRTVEDARRIFQGYLGERFSFDDIRARRIELSRKHYELLGVTQKPGARELIETLNRENIPCAVATSTKRSEALHKLEQTGLLSKFVGVSCGDEVMRGKPEPDLFLLAAKRAEIAPRHTIVLEDSPFGIQAARAAGMSSIFVPDLVAPTDDVRIHTLAILPHLGEATAHILCS